MTKRVINLGQFSRLQKIADTVSVRGNMGVVWDFHSIDTLWDRALWYNRKQNQLLKAGEEREVTKSIHALDQETGQLAWYNIRAQKSFSRLEWFKILAANDCALTIQQTREVVNV